MDQRRETTASRGAAAEGSGTRARPAAGSLVRRLALERLRELRLQGLSYREIGRRYGGPASAEQGRAGAPAAPLPAPEGEDSLADALRRSRFGLSRQEVRVAWLLAVGKSNGRIARELAISPHTARRHTERVMRKLRVGSRAEVAARLLRG